MPSFWSESVQTLFFDKSAGRARKIWSGDETTGTHEYLFFCWESKSLGFSWDLNSEDALTTKPLGLLAEQKQSYVQYKVRMSGTATESFTPLGIHSTSLQLTIMQPQWTLALPGSSKLWNAKSLSTIARWLLSASYILAIATIWWGFTQSFTLCGWYLRAVSDQPSTVCMTLWGGKGGHNLPSH